MSRVESPINPAEKVFNQRKFNERLIDWDKRAIPFTLLAGFCVTLICAATGRMKGTIIGMIGTPAVTGLEAALYTGLNWREKSLIKEEYSQDSI